MDTRTPAPTPQALLALGALGVVFGDIGTSPLYALQTVFPATTAPSADPRRRLGVISLVFWAISIVVTVKYVVFVMRADNDGEGGIMALLALAAGGRARAARDRGRCSRRSGSSARPCSSATRHHAGDLGALGGRGAQGRRARRSTHLVVPIAAAMLVGLFVVQRRGTAPVGRLFGPVMVVWFVDDRASLGRREIARHPAILAALSPTYGVAFFVDHACIGVPRPRRGRAGDHRRRGAVRRHGPLRPAARSARAWFCSSSRR